MIVEVFLNPVDHSLVVILDHTLLDVFRLQNDSLLSTSNSVHQVSVVFVRDVI